MSNLSVYHRSAAARAHSSLPILEARFSTLANLRDPRYVTSLNGCAKSSHSSRQRVARAFQMRRYSREMENARSFSSLFWVGGAVILAAIAIIGSRKDMQGASAAVPAVHEISAFMAHVVPGVMPDPVIAAKPETVPSGVTNEWSSKGPEAVTTPRDHADVQVESTPRNVFSIPLPDARKTSPVEIEVKKSIEVAPARSASTSEFDLGMRCLDKGGFLYTNPSLFIENGTLVLRLKLASARFHREDAHPEAARTALDIMGDVDSLESLRVEIVSHRGAVLERRKVSREQARGIFKAIEDNSYSARRVHDFWLQFEKMR